MKAKEVNYISAKEAAEKWGISGRRVRLLCEQGAIPGVIKKGRSYLIPTDAIKPLDKRQFRGKDISAQYIDIFSEIDAMKNELNRRRPFTQGELRRLQEEFLVEFTYDSNAIEGSTLTLQETALVLEGVTIDQKPLKEHLEAIGHRDAFLYVQNLVADKAKVSERSIKEIHSLVLMDRPEDKGVYRNIPVRIMGAHQEPPQPYLVPVRMEQIVGGLYKNNRHPIEEAALFHLDFEGVHPFIDGNGRTGRLVLNLMLMRHGYPPVNVKFSDRRRYYACFDSYYKDKEPVPMVLMVAGYLKEILRKYIDILN